MTGSARIDAAGAAAQAPATLWGLQALSGRRALVNDAFDAFTVQAYLRASGFRSSFDLDVHGGAYAEQRWSIAPDAGSA